MGYKSYKDLEIYKLAHKLAVEIHHMTMEELPKFERYEEGVQVRKSSKSVPTNIVEGFGRRRYKDAFIRFLIIVHASCNETIEHLEILYDTGSLKKDRFDYLLNEYNLLGRKLNRFISSVKEGHLI